MNITKPLISLLLLLVFGTVNAQDNQLHDYVRASINKTRTFYIQRDSLLKPNYKAPKVEDLKPMISVNKKDVDMDFLKLIAIKDTTKILNIAEKTGYIANSHARRVMINGWVQVEINKKVFKELWKLEKSNYTKKKR